MTPARVERPNSLDDLSKALAEAHRQGLACIPVGGGTRLAAGNTPERYDVAIDLAGMSSMIDHVPGDLTAVVDAGVRIQRLQEILATSGQRLPFEIAHPHKATVGGALASNPLNLTGILFGSIRDWVLGMKVVLADGTTTKTGGRVVKNVQGYDLHRLHTGAFGTLGVIAEVALKLLPIPDTTRTVAAWFASSQDAAVAAKTILDSPIEPEALTILAGPEAQPGTLGAAQPKDGIAGSTAALLARLAGGPAAVSRQVDMVTGAAGAAAADGYEIIYPQEAEPLWAIARGESFDPNGLTARITVKPSAIPNLLEEIEKRGAAGLTKPPSYAAHPGFGAAIVNWPLAKDQDARDAARFAFTMAERHRGHAVIETCPAAIKPEIDVFGTIGPSLEIMKRMKQQFDPARILSPGRFAGRI